jgi:putative transposase
VTAYGDANQHGWRLEVLLRPEGAKSFVVIERRWVVERTFSWLTADRRLARDYERKATSSETFIYMAMCRTLLVRLTK